MNTAADSMDGMHQTPEHWSQCLHTMAQNRDKALFSELFNYFAPRIKAYVIRLGLAHAAADEVAQETMLAVWRKANLFDASKANASTWIYTLARNQCIDRMRKDQRSQTYELADEAADIAENYDEDQVVVAERVQKVLNALPRTQAEVLFLSFYEGKSHSEIAEQLGIPLGSVKSRMRLAFDKVKHQWGSVR